MKMPLTVALIVLSASAWGADLTTVSPAGHKAMAPEIAVAKDGAISVIWLERTAEGEAIAAAGAASKEGHTHLAQTDLWYARSTDGGKTFAPPVRVNAESGVVWGVPTSKPRVAVSPDGVIHIFYPANATARKTGKALVMATYTRSTDNGRTFGPPIALGSEADSDNSDIVSGGLSNAQCFGTMTIDGKGGVYAYWIDTRDMSADSKNGKVFSAVSHDNGKSFGKDFEVFPADACPCCQVTAAVHEGRIYMGSRQATPDGNRDSVVAISMDRGTSFAPRVRWGGAHWPIEGCPLKPTTVAVSGRDVYLASYNGGASPQGVYFSRSTDGGRSFEPALALHPTATVSDVPVIAVADGRVIVAWQAKTTGDRRIHVAVSQDRGRTFSAPVELAAPAGPGINPVIAVRDKGVQLAWQQNDMVVTQYIAAGDPLLAAR